MYVSDYIYAVELIYWNLTRYNSDTANYRASKGHDWTISAINDFSWRITCYSRVIDTDGSVGDYIADLDTEVRQVFSLSSSV